MSHVNINRVTKDRWDDAIRISNSTVELLAPTTIGPRIAHFGFVDGPNEFQIFQEQRKDWPLLGGHRLWHAPEDASRTYTPDTQPVETTLLEDGVELIRPPLDETGIEKSITVRMGRGATVEVVHELTNRGLWPIEFAPWALSVLRPGGTAVLPFTPQADDDSLLPDRSLTFWPYTTPADDRIEYGDKHVFVDQDPNCDGPIKLGTSAGGNWVAYVNDGRAFRKDFEFDPEAPYPDMGCGTETYTNTEILELETLAPLRTVEPGDTAKHVETWTLAEVRSPSGASTVEPETPYDQSH